MLDGRMGMLPPLVNSIDEIQYVEEDSNIGDLVSKDGAQSERTNNNQSQIQKSPELHTVNEYDSTPSKFQKATNSSNRSA